jgi:hypothetical protein
LNRNWPNAKMFRLNETTGQAHQSFCPVKHKQIYNWY